MLRKRQHVDIAVLLFGCVRIWHENTADFGGQHKAVTRLALQRLAEAVLAAALAVMRRGVQGAAAARQCTRQQGLCIYICDGCEQVAQCGAPQTEAQPIRGGRENHAGHWGLRQDISSDASANMSVVNSSNPECFRLTVFLARCMLKGLSPLLSADLLYVLASMGHGDEIVLADANFPAATHASELIRLPGVSVARVLDAVLSVMPLDSFVAQGAMTMQVVGDAEAVPPAVADMQAVLARHGCPPAGSLERFAFYERAAGAFAVVATGETRIYGNVILRKGVVLQGGDE